MAARYLLDADILIEYLRGRPPARAFLEGLEGELYLSAITVAELYVGVRDPAQERALAQFLSLFQVVALDQELAAAAGALRRAYGRAYGPSHGAGLADAIVAATAVRLEATLVTFNQWHYPMAPELRVPYPRS